MTTENDRMMRKLKRRGFAVAIGFDVGAYWKVWHIGNLVNLVFIYVYPDKHGDMNKFVVHDTSDDIRVECANLKTAVETYDRLRRKT